jgi:hypothetical protein
MTPEDIARHAAPAPYDDDEAPAPMPWLARLVLVGALTTSIAVMLVAAHWLLRIARAAMGGV